MKSFLFSAAVLAFSLNLNALEVHGHRGARARFPENSLPAFSYALSVGVDVLELDMVVTKDDQVVVNHDLYIDGARCVGPDGQRLQSKPLIRDLTLAELKTFECGILPNPRFPHQVRVPGTQIPTLDEVFELVRTSKVPSASRVQFNIETKMPYFFWQRHHPSISRFVELVNSIVEKHGLADRVILQSFDFRTLAAMKKINPRIRLSALADADLRLVYFFVQNLELDYISPASEWVVPGTVEFYHSHGIRVLPWTVNRRDEWKLLMTLGVDGLITDDPEPLLRYLGR